MLKVIKFANGLNFLNPGFNEMGVETDGDQS